MNKFYAVRDPIMQKLCALIVSVCLIFEVYPQCHSSITNQNLPNLTVGAHDTICITRDLIVVHGIQVHAGGVLRIAPRVRVRCSELYSYGTIIVNDRGVLQVEAGANFEGAASVLKMEANSVTIVCSGLNVSFGAKVEMSQNCVFHSFSSIFSFSTNYLHYIGTPATFPQAHFIARASTIIQGALSNSNQIAYCGVTAGANISATAAGSAQRHCTSLIPPAVLNGVNCSAVIPFYTNAVLPVRFHYLTIGSEAEDRINRVSWVIEEDNTIEYYEVQRRVTDSFMAVARVRCAAYGERVRTYSFNDTLIDDVNGEVHYRVRAVRWNGDAFNSMVRRVTVTSSSTRFKVAPNPVINSMLVRIPEEVTGNATFEIINAAGIRVHVTAVRAVRPVYRVDANAVAKLSPGKYYLKMITKEKCYTAGFLKL